MVQVEVKIFATNLVELWAMDEVQKPSNSEQHIELLDMRTTPVRGSFKPKREATDRQTFSDFRHFVISQAY
jgi:hypothetical protein